MTINFTLYSQIKILLEYYDNIILDSEKYWVVVAGGAIRDLTLNSYAPKDIDIFTNFPGMPGIIKDIKYAGGKSPKLEKISKDGYENTGFTVYNTDYRGFLVGAPLQLIVTDVATPLNLVLDFPSALSQCYMEDWGKLIYSNNFADAMIARKDYVALDALDGDDPYKLAYINRIREKYPEYYGLPYARLGNKPTPTGESLFA